MSLSITKGSSTKYDSEILCKNNCGFFGNSIQWGGYCSICYRQLINKTQVESENEKKESTLNTSSTKQIWNEATNFTKFSNRKKPSEKATNKFSLFKRSNQTPAAASSATLPSSSSNNLANTTDHKTSDRKYSTATTSMNNNQGNLLIIDKHFLKSIDSNLINDNFSPLVQSLNKQMNKFLEQFVDLLRKNELTNTRQYEIVQDFYKKLYSYIQTHSSMKQYFDKISNLNNSNMSSSSSSNNNDTISINSLLQSSASFLTNSTSSNTSFLMQNNEEIEKLQDLLMIYVESCLTNSLYDYVFPSIMSEFEDTDIKIQKRIRNLNWITHEMIGTCLDENNILYRDSYEDSISYIIQMDSRRTPHDKMLSITECSKNIYKAINISSSNTKLASADDYLPAFIYIVIKTNPPLLYSNMNYIARFAFEKRVLQGEHAYYFCTLNAVITHIENITASHLNMSIEEFDKYCKGLTNSSQGIKIFKTNLKILVELKAKQEQLRKEAFKLQNDMNAFNECMRAKVLNCLDKNVDKHLNNVKAVNDWFRKNYNPVDDVLDKDQNSTADDLTEPSLQPTVVDTCEEDVIKIEQKEEETIDGEKVSKNIENKIDNSENFVQDARKEDQIENN